MNTKEIIKNSQTLRGTISRLKRKGLSSESL